jgi:ribosomal protein S18 acetylase RimI-like enzyme
VQRHDGTTGEIKRMWVHPAWRGVGLGRRMLTRLEEQVAALGYRRVVLDTNDTLTEAIAMYERAGYRAVDRYNDNPDAMCWFAKSLEPRPS